MKKAFAKIFGALKNRKGFTLVECLYAMAVFAIVASFITPIFLRANNEINQAESYDIERNLVLEQLENNKTDYILSYIRENGSAYPTEGAKQVILPAGETPDKQVKLISMKKHTAKVEKPSVYEGQDNVMYEIEGWMLKLKSVKGRSEFEIFVSCKEVGIDYDGNPLDSE